MTPLRVVPLICCLALMGACSKAHREEKESPMNNPSSPEPMPIACRPHALSKDERARSQALRSELASATAKTREIEGGYAFAYRADASLFQKAAEWVGLERRCCPFLTFELRWSQGDDAAPELLLTGPKGTKEFLAAEMPELPLDSH